MNRSLSPAHSLQRIATLAWVGALLALTLGTLAIWSGFSTLFDARDRVFNRLDPALVATQGLRVSLLDQETGIRGYALTRDERLLEPYKTGQADQAKAASRLRKLLRGDPLEDEITNLLTDVEEAMVTWRTDIAGPLLNAPTEVDDVGQVFFDSKTSYDRIRAKIDKLDDAVEAQRVEARAQLTATTDRLIAAIAGALGVLGVTSLSISWLLRRNVVAPIKRLAEAADAVAGDKPRQPIEVRGPTEIEHLAVRVGEMRDRILADLAAVKRTTEELDRRAFELARSNADLEQFAYVASHDLQEPLRKVASFCQLLEQRYGDQLDDRALSYIEYAVDGAKRMQDQIADLLEFSRVGRANRPSVDCDMSVITAEAIDGLSTDLTGASVTVGPLPVIPGDPTLYRSLMQNLVSNAIKYRGSGNVPTLSISAESTKDGWTFCCSDRGIGIEPDYRDQVFVIFQRLHSRDEFEGTGIGLALCKRIVEFSGGRIWVDDPEDGVGTTIRWTIPNVAPPQTELGPQ